MRNRTLFGMATSLALALAPAPLVCQAQETRGSIPGRVVDSSGAVVAGATVSATDIDTFAATA